MTDDYDIEEDVAVLPPPRELRGRRARKIWREIAPAAGVSGRLTIATTPLLTVLCVLLAKIQGDPANVDPQELKQASDLAHRFGVLRR
jgi:hypothetical protein